MQSRGFTLIELLVVIAVMGAVMALVGPFGAEQIAKSERLQEARTLRSMLERQAQTAFLTGSGYEISFDGRRFVIENTASEQSAIVEFKHLFFPQHRTYLNLNGLYSSPEIQYYSGGQQNSLSLRFTEPERE